VQVVELAELVELVELAGLVGLAVVGGVAVVGGATVVEVDVPRDGRLGEDVGAVVEPPTEAPGGPPSAQAASASTPDAAKAAALRARRPRRAPAGSVVAMSMDATVSSSPGSLGSPGSMGSPGSPGSMGSPGSQRENGSQGPSGSPASESRRPVALDVDTGVDDACAILLAAAHPALDLRAVTCVGGNASVDDVVANTLTVLDAAGRADVPVARGADRPLLEPAADARHVHGEDGMGDLDWPRSERSPDPRPAVELVRDVLLAAADAGERVTLVPMGPLTNVALLLRTYPSVADGVSEIVFMGGAVNVGNATASAEFNVFHDPEAAAITLDAAAHLGIPVTMYGLDVFYAPRVTRSQAEELIAVGGRRSAELAGRLVQFQCDRFAQDDATIGDAGVVCAVIDRDAITSRRLPVRVELAGSWSRGRTIVDRRDWSGDLAHDPHGQAPSTVDVALELDAERYRRLWLDTVSAR